MAETEEVKMKYLQQIYNHIQDGVIIMKESREIVMINPAAVRLTGWQVGNRLPLCNHCLQREAEGETPSCYLIANPDISYIITEMQINPEKKLDLEISMSKAEMSEKKEKAEDEYIVVLRDQFITKQAEENVLNKRMIRKLIEVQEAEHKRLAQELHDGVGQSLYTVAVALKAIEAYVKDHEVLIEYIAEVRSELQKVMDDVNNYSHDLRPHSLDQLGLESTIRNLIASIEKNIPELRFHFEAENLNRCDPSVEINLYRVVQEAFHNITKYAEATEVNLFMTKDEKKIYLTLEDNGVGFDGEKVKSEGLGLKHMEERVDQLGGTFEITSAIGKGTKINIVVPRWRAKR